MLTLLGLFLVSVQAGQPLVGFAVMMTALLSTAAIAWKTVARRHAPALALRDRGDAQVAGGHYVAARSLYEQSLTLALRELPVSAPEVLLNYYSLAAVNSVLHDHERASLYLDKLFRGLNHRIPSAWSGQIAWLLRRVAYHHSMQGQHARAVELCQRALELVGDAPGADDNTVRSLLDDLAWVHHHAGEYPSAEALFRDALGLHEQYRDIVLELSQRPAGGRTGAASPYRAPSPAVAVTSGGLDRATAQSLLGLGWSRYEQAEYSDASEMFSRAHLIAVAAQGGMGLRSEILRGQAAIAMTRGSISEAFGLHVQAQRLALERDSALAKASLRIDASWFSRVCRRYADAEIALIDAARSLDSPLEGVPIIRCTLHEQAAELRRAQGRVRDAHREITQALALAERHLGAEHPRRASMLALASRIHTLRAEYPDAERWVRQALNILRATLRPDHPRFALAYIAVAEVHLARGHLGAAEEAFGKARSIRAAAFGPEHPEMIEILDGLAAVYRATGRESLLADAEALAQRLRDDLDAFTRALRPTSPPGASLPGDQTPDSDP